MTYTIIRCIECEKEILDPQRKKQKFCSAHCSHNNLGRNAHRKKRNTKPENFRSRYKKNEKSE